MPDSDLIRQHKNLAMGGSLMSGDFGVAAAGSMRAGHGAAQAPKRAATAPVKSTAGSLGRVQVGK